MKRLIKIYNYSKLKREHKSHYMKEGEIIHALYTNIMDYSDLKYI